jgi:hypothetical protein
LPAQLKIGLVRLRAPARSHHQTLCDFVSTKQTKRSTNNQTRKDHDDRCTGLVQILTLAARARLGGSCASRLAFKLAAAGKVGRLATAHSLAAPRILGARAYCGHGLESLSLSLSTRSSALAYALKGNAMNMTP